MNDLSGELAEAKAKINLQWRILALMEENASLRKDAGRYRWLRAGGQEPHEEMDGEQLIAGYYVTTSNGYDTYMNGLAGEELDSAIDALNRSPENH